MTYKMEINKIDLEEKGKIKEIAGVYLLYDKGYDIIYVGRTINLRQRLWAHTSPNNSKYDRDNKYGASSMIPRGEAVYYSFIEIENKEERAMVEHIFIYYLKPKYNKVR